MSKHHRIWNQSIHEKYLREGRGCGSGIAYSPWVQVQDFASRGVVSRVKGRTTGRIHHLMSNNELAYFYILDWSDSVTDIREQYPLSDLECAVKCAATAGIRYPKDNVSGYPYVLTCDFMITSASGLKARTVKQSAELNNPRVLEKLEIERRYWFSRGIDWKIVTENEISRQKAKNIEWLYTAIDFSVSGCSEIEIEQAKIYMLDSLRCGENSAIEVVQMVEDEFMLASGAGLQLFKQLVLDGRYALDISQPLDLTEKAVAA
ncbi:MAG: TnsA endonuclease N-terminal domain-containing protein [Peptococcaceae bacterium]|jgi:hypothetical protein|nr:TnsA endonuclease N-terminal domain-containing protein [Peptococcaceae bacterium]